MIKPYSRVQAITVLLCALLAACSSASPNDPKDTVPLYTPSTDTHPCLSVEAVAPDVIKLGTEATVRVEVNNTCNEATSYTSSTPPYFLQLVSANNEVVWFEPETITSLPGEYVVPANGIMSYDVAVALSADSVTPGAYRVIANLYVDQDTGPDATQYVEPLRLESEAKNVNVEP